jgi:hypothetical protein
MATLAHAHEPLPYSRLSVFPQTNLGIWGAHRVPVDVRFGPKADMQCKKSCPLYPRKQTFGGASDMVLSPYVALGDHISSCRRVFFEAIGGEKGVECCDVVPGAGELDNRVWQAC